MSVKIQEIYEKFLEAGSISTDTRKEVAGTMYLAMDGKTFKNNTFTKEALEKGCLYAVTNDNSIVDSRIILVSDATATFQQLANYHRKQLKIPLIGITGSNGKTTTKQLCSRVLSQKFNVLYTAGNFNDQIGLPMTLVRLRKEHEIAVIELGVGNFGDMRQLLDMAEPNYGIITNIGKAHLDNFKTLENVLKEKGELYEDIRKNNGVVFVNSDNSMLMKATEGMQRILYSPSEKEKIHGKILNKNPFVSFEWTDGTSSYQVQTHLLGGYNLQNLLCAISVGLYFKVEPEQINKALESYTPSNHRSQYQITQKNHLIIDAYNANPTSMSISLDNFDELQFSPKMVILGQMLRLGEIENEEHEKIIQRLKNKPYQKVFLVGQLFPKSEDIKGICYFENIDALRKHLTEQQVKGYYIFIKGSHANKLESILELL